jgi:hypothetical protein
MTADRTSCSRSRRRRSTRLSVPIPGSWFCVAMGTPSLLRMPTSASPTSSPHQGGETQGLAARCYKDAIMRDPKKHSREHTGNGMVRPHILRTMVAWASVERSTAMSNTSIARLAARADLLTRQGRKPMLTDQRIRPAPCTSAVSRRRCAYLRSWAPANGAPLQGGCSVRDQENVFRVARGPGRNLRD